MVPSTTLKARPYNFYVLHCTDVRLSCHIKHILLLLLLSYTTAAVSLSVAKHQPELVQYSVCQAAERLLDQLQADVVISVLSAAAQVYMESAAYTMFSLMTCR